MNASATGKAVRMGRLLNRATGRGIILTLDHGVTSGPLPGLVPVRRVVQAGALGGADAALMHKGLVHLAYKDSGQREGRALGLMVHLSGSTDLGPDPDWKVLVATVEEAVRLGADGVSVHVNLGGDGEAAMLADLGRVAKEAADWGMPLMAMMYARGERVADPFAPAVVAHAARVGMELGADMIKVPYTGDPESFAQVVAGCGLPVFAAGGPKTDGCQEFFRMVAGALAGGCSGFCVGRNIFQHPRPADMVSALAGMTHHGWTVAQALETAGEA